MKDILESVIALILVGFVCAVIGIYLGNSFRNDEIKGAIAKYGAFYINEQRYNCEKVK